MDAIYDSFDGIDLVGPHHQEPLLAGHQHHVAADHLPQGTLGRELLGKTIEQSDFLVVFAGELVNRQEALIRVKAEVPCVVVGEVPGIGAVADDEELQEAQQRFAVAIAGIGLVINDLLHGPAWADCQGLQLDLHHRHTVDEQHHVVTVMAIFSVHTQLVDDLEVVFAPVSDVDQGVVQRRAIVALEAVDIAKPLSSAVDIGRDDAVEQALKLAVCQVHAVKRLEFGPEVGFERGSIANIGAIGVLEVTKLGDQIEFDLLFCGRHKSCLKFPTGYSTAATYADKAVQIMLGALLVHQSLHQRRLHAPTRLLRTTETSTTAPHDVQAVLYVLSIDTQCP